MTPLDPQELIAAVIGHAVPVARTTDPQAELPPDEAERRQNVWWSLILAGILLLSAETIVANRLSREERFT